MTGFNIVYSLFGLVLGLAVTTVLSGFVKMIKMRRKAHIGLLVPLLAVVVLLDLVTFWDKAYELRNVLTPTSLTMYVVMAVIGAYYLIASLIIPDDPDEWPDFDLYFDRYNRVVLGGMFLINFVTFCASITVLLATGWGDEASKTDDSVGLYGVLLTLAPVPLIIALLFVRSRRWKVALLCALVASYLGGAIAQAMGV